MGNFNTESLRSHMHYDRFPAEVSERIYTHRLPSHQPESVLSFQEKRTRHEAYKIAEPEKALLDWVYLQRQEELPTALDELSFKPIDRKKLQKYAAKYPNSVQQTLRDAP